MKLPFISLIGYEVRVRLIDVTTAFSSFLKVILGVCLMYTSNEQAPDYGMFLILSFWSHYLVDQPNSLYVINSIYPQFFTISLLKGEYTQFSSYS